MTDTETEVVTPEVVTPEVVTPDAVTPAAATGPGTDIEPHADGTAALEAAEAAAVALPGVPGRDEFLSLAMQARILSLSGAAPKLVRNDAYIAFHVAMVGRDLGISPSAALELIDVIDTRGGPRISLSPQLLNGQIRRLGLGAIRPKVQARDRCVAVAVGPDKEILGETEFTWDDARDAGLVGPNCEPGNHRKNRDNRCPCNQGYVTYPKRMMWWRAAGFCADDYFPEAGLGLYSPEALGAVVDEDGRPIDPATVALPEGYEDPGEQKTQRRAEAQAQAEAPAPADELWALQERILRLPDDAQDGLRTAWDAEESNIRGYSPVPGRKGRPVLPASKLRIAKAMVNAWEGNARKAGADLDAAVEGLRATLWAAVVAFFCSWTATGTGSGPQSAQEPSKPEPGPETHDGPSEPQSGDEGPPSGDAGGTPVPDGAPEPDSKAIAQGLSQTLARACDGVPDTVIQRIAADVKAMHWSKVDSALDDAGIPHAGLHIDVRRMHLSLLRLRAFRSAQGWDDVRYEGQPDSPIWEPRDGEEPF